MPLWNYPADDHPDAPPGRRVRTVLIAGVAFIILATFVALHLLGVMRPSH